ncbi:MAG TPA: glycoside hydrolase family 9 protein, partial [Blastocatellia bacterium]|nr:glycoside hydrolase family 9 protein [Blastocatellia bacterium]
IALPVERLHTSSAAAPPPPQSSNFNYGEALQKAIWFYEAQVSGPKPASNRVTWRGDSALGDGSDVGLNLTGGWFDAGDHIKFGFAMASSAAMLAWGGVEYRQAYQTSGQLQNLLNNLRVANDYFIKAHTAPNELWGQIGEEGPDHSFWGPAEIMQMQRRAFKIDMAHPGSDLAAETAAALAASSIVFRPTDPAYADTLVAHARQLFAFAEATPGTFYVDSIPAAQCCYNSRFGNPIDEVTWAAVWLFRATNEASFMTRARQLYPTMCKENDGVTPCFTWSQNWNDKHFGVYVLMSKLTGEAQFKTDAQRWLDFWSVGSGRRTNGGLMFVDGFGALRYATNTAFIALVYADVLGTADPLFARYHDFGKRQIDYVLGANPANHSYVCGFGNNPPINPHHRTAHGSWVNGGPTGVPLNNRHVLYGGLVGGPTAQDDFSWADDRGNFRANEVATDFNAGFAGALARLFSEFGGAPLTNFPPIETPDDDEIYIEAGINVAGTNFTEIRSFVVNRSAWPARMLDRGTFRYFFTLEPGVTPSQITLNQNFSQCTGGITGPIQWSGNIYYVQINCLGTKIFPGGQSEFRREIQFRITSSGAWNPADDPSFQDLAGLQPGQPPVRTRRIVLYDNGVRIWGTEPGAGNASPVAMLTAPANGQTFTAPANITMNATATDSDGTVARVEFLNGNTVIGTDTTAPYSFVFSNVAAGNYALSARAVDNGGAIGLSNVANVTVNPAMNPDFSLSASPTSLTVNRGASGTSTITITRLNGFTSSVAFTASGLPTGVTAAFNPTSTIGTSSVLTLAASATATIGTSTVTVTGTGGGLTRVTTISLTVPPPPDFTLAASPAALTVNQGASGTSTITITRTGGFTSAVAFSATGLPTGVTASFNPASATGNSSVVTLAASTTATLGAAMVTITGTGGGLSRVVQINLTVNPVQTPDFSLSANPAAVTVNQGASATSTITITRIAGFASGVALSATGLPSGVTATFNPATATGTSSTLTLAASSAATAGQASVTVSGTGGGLTRTVTINLTVNPGGGNGGVTITPVINANSPWFNEEALQITNTGTLTSLSITIVIQRTTGISFNGQYNTVGGQILQSNTSTATTITYQFTLAAGQTLSPGTNRVFAAQTSGSGTAHPMAGDTFTVTYTTGGVTFTQTNHF